MTIRSDTVALFQTAQQSLALLEAQATAVKTRRDALAVQADAYHRGSQYMLANGLYNRLVDAINQNKMTIANLLDVLDPFDDAYDFNPPIPLTLTPYGLIERVTGFSSYTDPTVRQLAANVVTTAVNNRVSVLEDQKPADIATFYDGNKFVALEGDALLFRITLNAKPNNFADIASQMKMWLDYGGGVRLFEQTKPLVGFDVNELVTYQVAVYIGPTFAANGAMLKLEADGPVEIKDMSYFVTRLHKGLP